MSFEKIKILVTGATGNLGTAFMQGFKNYEYIDLSGICSDDLDLTNKKQIKKYFKTYKPDLIIHCAAFTNVDLAEVKKEECYKLNVLSTMYLAKIAKKLSIPFIFISTDFVFSGDKQFYKVDDDYSPLNYYGVSKMLAEQYIIRHLKKYYIVRTSSLFGSNKKDFVKTMFDIAQKEDISELEVVADQVTSPTYVYDLADAIRTLLLSKNYGIYHLTSTDHVSKAKLSEFIFKYLKKDITVKPITTEEYTLKVPTNVPRPPFIVLENNSNIKMRSWKPGVREYLNKLSKGK